MKENTTGPAVFDEALVQQAIGGDGEAFSLLYEKIENRVLLLCVKYMGNKQDGEDAAQEVYIKIQRGMKKLQDPKLFQTWVYRITLNVCTDFYRKNTSKSVEPIEDYLEHLVEEKSEFIPSEFAEDSAKKEVLISYINRLPDNLRQVIYLYYYEELTISEVANVLDISPSMVNYLLRRARKELRKELEEALSDGGMENDMPLPALLGAGGTVKVESLVKKVVKDGVKALLKPASEAVWMIKVAGVAASVALTAGTVFVFAQQEPAPVNLSSFPTSSAVNVQSSQVPQPDGSLSVTAEDLDIDSREIVSQQTASSESVSAQVVVPSTAVDGVPAPNDTPSIVQVPSSLVSQSSESQQSSAPASSEQGPAPVQVQLQGKVTFVDNQNNTVPDAAGYVAGSRIELKKDDVVCATALVDEQGAYGFTVPIKEQAEYTVHLLCTSSEISFAQGGTARVVLSPNWKTTRAPDIFVTDNTAPRLRIEFRTENDTTLRVNPTRATVMATDNLPVTCSWKILDRDGMLLYSGEGTEMDIPLYELPKPVGTGTYWLVAEVSDLLGNTSSIREVFYRTYN